MGKRGSIEPRPGTVAIADEPVGTIHDGAYPPVTSLYEYSTFGGVSYLIAFAGNELKRLSVSTWALINDTLSRDTFLEFVTYPIVPYDNPTMNCLFVNGRDGYWQTDAITASEVTPYIPLVHTIEGVDYDEEIEIGACHIPSRPRYIEIFDNRVWLAHVEGARNRVYMNVDDLFGNSMYNYFTHWSWLRIANTRGESITGIKAFKNTLYVFTPTTIHAIYPSQPIEIEDVVYTPPSYEVVEISSNIGSVAQRTIKEVRGNLMFMGIDGVYMFDGTSAPFKVSQRIDPTLDMVDHDNWNRACSSIWKYKYFLSVPMRSG